MTASTRARTTIGQLVYPSMPAINFLRLVADLDAALVGCDAGDLRFNPERDDLALIDAAGSRVGLAVSPDFDGNGAAAITISVGYGPEETGDVRLARRQAVLARLIVDRIATRFVPQETIWTDSDEVASVELLDRTVADLTARRRLLLEARAERVQQRRQTPRHFIGSDDLPRLLARFDATLDVRREGPPTPGEGQAVRREPTEEARRSSAPLRLAAHLIDATLMIVALPVGAAMMIYSLVRGADLDTSARAMALSGTGIGLLQIMGGPHGLQALLHLS